MVQFPVTLGDTVFHKKHVTMSLMISWTRTVSLQTFLE